MHVRLEFIFRARSVGELIELEAKSVSAFYSLSQRVALRAGVSNLSTGGRGELR